jgi:hypothetical protein
MMLSSLENKGPATHIRGTTTIDGIFATDGIVLEQWKYTSFQNSPSDHRWIVVDISERSLLGASRYDKCTKLNRKATTKMPSVKLKFQQLLEQQVLLHNIGSKMDYLYDRALTNKKINREDRMLYKQIETRMQRAVKYADHHCMKARRGQIPYSPEQKRLMGEIIVLRQLKLRFLLRGKKNRPRSTRIRHLINKYKYTGKQNF